MGALLPAVIEHLLAAFGSCVLLFMAVSRIRDHFNPSYFAVGQSMLPTQQGWKWKAPGKVEMMRVPTTEDVEQDHEQDSDERGCGTELAQETQNGDYRL